MAVGLDRVIGHLRQLVNAPGGERSDRELVEAFATEGDPSSFALLLARHGPMVLAVCRRLLCDAQEAEDAFQAAWLVLVRKARSMRFNDSIAAWMHAVAVRVALK